MKKEHNQMKNKIFDNHNNSFNSLSYDLICFRNHGGNWGNYPIFAPQINQP